MKKGYILSFIIIFTMVFGLTGCGIYGPEEETTQIDPPPAQLDLGNNTENLSTENTNTQEAGQGEEVAETVNLTLYFFDDKEDVVPLSMEIPDVEGIAKQVLEYMIVGSPVEMQLPTGFKPVIPAGTKIDTNVKLDQKLMIIDFSKEFLNYEAASPEEEKKILDAITWSMTEFPTVEQVEIRVNGYVLEEMPVWKTPIVGPLSRADGINLELASNINIGQTTPVTLYFNRVTQDHTYLVPVTRLIPRTDNLAKATIEELINGPKAGTDLTSALLPSTTLLGVEVSNDLLVADFDEELLGFDNQLSSDLVDMIIWSLSENIDVPAVQIQVKGDILAIPENLSKPVLKPENINAIIF